MAKINVPKSPKQVETKKVIPGLKFFQQNAPKTALPVTTVSML
jgi:hypothetical protein